MKITLGLLLVGLVGACGAKTSGPTTLQVADGDAQKAAAANAKDLQKEIYGSVRRGKLDGLQNLIAEEFFCIGPAAGQRYEGREAAFLALASGFERKKHKLVSKALRSTSSPGGKSAWVSDEIDLDRVRYRVTTVYSELDELWVARASFMTAPDSVDAVAVLDGTPTMGGDVEPAAAELVELLSAALADPKVLEAQWADHKGVTFIGPGKRDTVRGKKAITKLWKKLVVKPKWVPAIIGEPRARLTADLGLGWVATAIDATTGDGKHRKLRAFAVYSQQDSGWRLEVLHLASMPAASQ